MEPERVSNIKTFISKYNWNGINYASKIGDWKTFEKKIIRQFLLIFCILKNVLILYLKNNSNCEKNSINDSKERKRRLYYLAGEKTINIIKRNNIKKSW